MEDMSNIYGFKLDGYRLEHVLESKRDGLAFPFVLALSFRSSASIGKRIILQKRQMEKHYRKTEL
jgi:hypothetical protein